MPGSRFFHAGALSSLVLLILWLLAWETVIAPPQEVLRPWLWIKALPLLIPLGGVIKRDIYTLQWSSMVILVYFTEGVVRAWSAVRPLSQVMAWGEIVLVLVYFACALLYLRPYKREAKRIAKELLEKVNSTKAK